MAIAAMSFGIEDSRGRVRRTIARVVRGTQTLTELQAWANNFANVLDDVTDCRIKDAIVELPLSLSGAITGKTPAANSDSDVGATFSLLNSSNVRDSLFVPGFLHALASKDIPLTGNAAVEAFVTACVTGVSNGTGTVGLVDENELDIIQAVRAFRSKRK